MSEGIPPLTGGGLFGGSRGGPFGGLFSGGGGDSGPTNQQIFDAQIAPQLAIRANLEDPAFVDFLGSLPRELQELVAIEGLSENFLRSALAFEGARTSTTGFQTLVIGGQVFRVAPQFFEETLPPFLQGLSGTVVTRPTGLPQELINREEARAIAALLEGGASLADIVRRFGFGETLPAAAGAPPVVPPAFEPIPELTDPIPTPLPPITQPPVVIVEPSTDQPAVATGGPRLDLLFSQMIEWLRLGFDLTQIGFLIRDFFRGPQAAPDPFQVGTFQARRFDLPPDLQPVEGRSMANLEGLLGTLLAGAPGIIQAIGGGGIVSPQFVQERARQVQFPQDPSTGSALVPNAIECNIRRPRNPTTVNVPDPCNSKIIDTYVKAPRTSWKVVRRAKPCSGRRRR